MRLITLFVLLGSITICNAQLDDSALKDRNTWQTFTYDMGNVFGGVGFAYSRPLHWEGRDWARLGGVTAGTLGLHLLDDEAKDYFSNQRAGVPEFIQDFGWYYGSPQNNYGIMGAVYFTGLITKNPKLRRTGVLLISSATAAGFLQQLTKTLVGRARPISGFSSTTFKPFSGDAGFRSFPSGHTVLAFTNAYALAKQFKSPWVKAGIYTVGMIPGISRLWIDAHWLTDVALSVAMSIAIVESIDRYLDRKYDEKYNANSKKLSWDLRFSPGQLGVAVRF